MVARAVVRALFALVLTSIPAFPNSQACAVRFAAYDPVGKPIEVSVQRVAPESDPSVDLLTASKQAVWLTEANTTVHFAVPSIVGRTFTVQLLLSQKESKTMRVAVMQCPQRVSIRWGEVSDQFGDFAFSEVRGRVTGCATRGDWWVRAMPMFGGATEAGYRIFEGVVEEDGAFRLAGHLSGERHILVIGKGRHALKVTEFDFGVGKVNPPLLIDMQGSCPSK